LSRIIVLNKKVDKARNKNQICQLNKKYQTRILITGRSVIDFAVNVITFVVSLQVIGPRGILYSCAITFFFTISNAEKILFKQSCTVSVGSLI